MSGVFQDVTIEWEGVKYTIPSDRMFGAIMVIENHVTLLELHRMANAGAAFKMTQIASAYQALLEYAGAKELDAEHVYKGMYSGEHIQANVMSSITSLLHLMVPPRQVVPDSGEHKRRKTSDAGRSSRKRTRRQ